MLTGRIHSTESCGTVDGQGIRFIVFVQGCLMRCKYCHNRDSWDENEGKEVTVAELMNEIRAYKNFFTASGGGVTVSGGEALLQKEFVTELFKACKAEGINTCLDTNGFLRDYDQKIVDLLAVTDLVMLDLKQMSENAHINLTKVSNRYAIKFALYLHKINQPTWIRYVVVPTYSDDLGSAALLAQFIRHMENVERLELLPYHEMGTYKWEQYGEKYELSHINPPTKGSMESLANLFKAYKINVVY